MCLQGRVRPLGTEPCCPVREEKRRNELEPLDFEVRALTAVPKVLPRTQLSQARFEVGVGGTLSPLPAAHVATALQTVWPVTS